MVSIVHSPGIHLNTGCGLPKQVELHTDPVAKKLETVPFLNKSSTIRMNLYLLNQISKFLQFEYKFALNWKNRYIQV